MRKGSPMSASTKLRSVLTVLAAMAVVVPLYSCSSDGDTITDVTEVTNVADIYGNGSAGDSTFTSSTTFSDENPQYRNFTVEAGVTLTIPSGVVIRCTGTFTNDGTIVVQTGAQGAAQEGHNGLHEPIYVAAEPGVALRAPSNGEWGPDTDTRFGGAGGIGTGSFLARQILRPGPKAGSGAGGSFGQEGADGGGSLVILAKNAIDNTGAITANGQFLSARSGGGGGGIVIMGSNGTITNTGTIAANGANGGASDSFAGPGGGGGGGIIHFLAPNVTAGTTSVGGGSSGTAGANITIPERQGGGGGGACGGSGGDGGSVSSSDAVFVGFTGSSGFVLTTIANPSSLFLAQSAGD